MKRSIVIVVAAGLGLVVVAGDLFARGGGGGGGGGRGGFSGGHSGGHSRSVGGHSHGASRSVGTRTSVRSVQRATPARTASTRTAASRTSTRVATTRTSAAQRTAGIIRTSALISRYAAGTGARGLLPLAARGRVRSGGGLGGSGGGDGGNGGEEMTSEEPTEVLYGMEIQDMEETGTAATGGMKVGDVILAINGMATTDFDSMRAALESCGEQAEFEFINVENGQAERIELQVDDSRIGTTVEQVQVQ